MNALRAALESYVPHDAGETDDVARVLAILEAGDPWSRAMPLHVTASALVLHPPSRRVLLRWHARMQRWLQVGGHADPGETDPWTVALREAEEETGLTDLVPLRTEPIQVVVVPVPAGRGEPAHEHADVRYLLATSTPDAIRAESTDSAVRWCTFPEARATVAEDNLRTLLARAEAILDT